METSAEFVEGFADVQHFFGVGDAVGAAEGLVFVEADVVLVVVFEGVADADPGGGPVFADLRELSEAVLDVVLEGLEFFGIVGEVEGKNFSRLLNSLRSSLSLSLHLLPAFSFWMMRTGLFLVRTRMTLSQ